MGKPQNCFCLFVSAGDTDDLFNPFLHESSNKAGFVFHLNTLKVICHAVFYVTISDSIQRKYKVHTFV